MIFNDDFYDSIIENKCFVTKKKAERFIQRLYDTLFQIGNEQIKTKMALDNEFKILEIKLKNILSNVIESDLEIEKITTLFCKEIPRIYKLLQKDAAFMTESDPASDCQREIEIAYPGFFTIAIYRFAHIFHKNKIPFLARILSEYAHNKTGIDIHPGAQIGSPFMIDHGTGIVIGETTIIGNRVKIFQGVTLGALSVSSDKRKKKRHPTIEDNVVIYAGATILGGATIIGEKSIIGGNVWLTASVDKEAKVFHKSQIYVKGNKINEPINFTI